MNDDLTEKLHSFFSNPRLAGRNAQDSWEKYNKHNPSAKIKLKDFKEHYKSRASRQIFARLPKPKEYLPIFSKDDNSFQIDLTYMNAAGYSSGYNYLFTAIDVNSRYAYAYPLKSKSGEEVKHVIEKFLSNVKEKTGEPVYSITSDLGSEFVAGEVQNYLEKVGVKMYFANADDKNKMGKIERFHRTLKQMMAPNLEETGKTWSELLPDIIANYNDSKHRALGKTPEEYNEKDKAKQYLNYKDKYKRLVGEKDDEPKYEPGTKVRLRVRKGLYNKGSFEPTFSPEIYEIVKNYPSATVNLRSSSGEIMSDKKGSIRFKPYDILPIGNLINKNSKFFEKLAKEKKERSNKRKLKIVGIDNSNIINKRTRGKKIKAIFK